ncbi:alpha/beta hydrolase fold domain-containing protein [Streptomyces sparsogenes]|uniref:alpha/beta hydrolase fold domain-containing protein n=1 Tax=Streptomyces sparsogenes TaxID=67365 RepID=UPI0033F55667
MARTHPPLDPELAAVLTGVHEHLSPTITAEDIEELRANPIFAVPDELLTRNGTLQLQNVSVPGPAGAPEVSLLVLKPVGLAPGAPILYYMHGGGLIIGNNRTVAGGVLDWAVDIGAIVVSVEYRLAPEHPDPAPIEDCYAGLLLPTPGHSPGSISALVSLGERHPLLTGDALYTVRHLAVDDVRQMQTGADDVFVDSVRRMQWLHGLMPDLVVLPAHDDTPYGRLLVPNLLAHEGRLSEGGFAELKEYEAVTFDAVYRLNSARRPRYVADPAGGALGSVV